MLLLFVVELYLLFIEIINCFLFIFKKIISTQIDIIKKTIELVK